MSLGKCELVAVVLMTVAGVLTADRAAANTGISVEAVDIYCNSEPICSADGCNLCNEQANVDGLQNNLTRLGSWTQGVHYTNGQVYDSDFMDPERVANGDDTRNFDRPGDAISMVSAHGSCDDGTTINCNSASDCPHGLLDPAYVCQPYGPNSFGPPPSGAWRGRCLSQKDRHLVLNGGVSHFANRPDYSAGGAAIGEDAYSGTWGRAGTNGGVNFSVVHNSCGIRAPWYWQEAGSMFAGVQNIGFIMPTSTDSDAVDSPYTGSDFAAGFVSTPTGSISYAFVTALNSDPLTDGYPCPVYAAGGDFSKGGGHGLQACGAYVSMSVDSSQTAAQWDNGTESWWDAQVEGNAAKGSAYWAALYVCNFDCRTYPLYY